MSFNVLDESWELRTIGDLVSAKEADIQTGPFGTMLQASSYAINGTPVIAVKDIGINKIIHGNSPLINDADTERLSRYKLLQGDIIFGRKGAVDRRALVTVKEEGWIQGSDCIRIRFTSPKIDPIFVSYFLGTKFYINWILSNAQGTTMSSLNQEILKRVPLPIPSIEEQRRIASVLQVIDEKIELNNAITKNLEEMAQVLFKRWFVDFEFPNENDEPYKSSGGEFEESELGLIPKGWSISLLEEFCYLSTEGVKPYLSADDVYEHYSIPAYDEGKMPVFELGSEIKSNKYKVHRNSILVSKLNPETKRIWLPYCITENAVCSTEFMNYLPKDQDSFGFCYLIFNSESFNQFLISNTTGSTNSRQRAKPKATLNYKIATGNRSLIRLFSRTVEAIYKQVSEFRLQNKKLADTRDTLLPKLMSGELRVPLEKNYKFSVESSLAAESKAQYSTT
ncbi:restriction endonuclease subunit S [Cohnella hongkongensis]|uniref:Restriction endonuclease subunit S n=1 Tax=Cohnella hongkongensis TaxID=178337 RepID=A0ABV9FC10_9BACL